MTARRPTRPAGPLVSPGVASDLTGLPKPVLGALIDCGVIRTERIDRHAFVALDDVERAVQGREGGGR
jgi:hypothetical protein